MKTMKKIVSLEIFKIFDNIALNHDIGVKEWAEVSGLPQTRISELRRLCRITQIEGSEKIGRAFSIEKCVALLDGLKSIIGGEELKKELLKALEYTETVKEQNIIMLLMLSDSKQDLLKVYLKTLIDLPEKGKDKK